jgi:hypothetical protein
MGIVKQKHRLPHRQVSIWRSDKAEILHLLSWEPRPHCSKPRSLAKHPFSRFWDGNLSSHNNFQMIMASKMTFVSHLADATRYGREKIQEGETSPHPRSLMPEHISRPLTYCVRSHRFPDILKLNDEASYVGSHDRHLCVALSAICWQPEIMSSRHAVELSEFDRGGRHMLLQLSRRARPAHPVLGHEASDGTC